MPSETIYAVLWCGGPPISFHYTKSGAEVRMAQFNSKRQYGHYEVVKGKFTYEPNRRAPAKRREGRGK